MLKITDLSFGYRPGKKIIERESFEFLPGKTYGIIGRNGSGKTTLLNVIAGLLTGYQGEVCWEGLEAKRRDKKYFENMFYIPENPVRSDLRIQAFFKLGACYPRWDKEIFETLLKKNGLDASVSLKSLSHGWLKRFYFYFGLALQTKLLIMDEVNDGMDMPAQKELVREMVKHHDPERIVLLASHHMEECQSLIDDLVVMDEGAVYYTGSMDQALSMIGWVESEKASCPEEDILDRKKILGAEYLLIRHPRKYGNAVHTADLGTFLEAVTLKRKEFTHDK